MEIVFLEEINDKQIEDIYNINIESFDIPWSKSSILEDFNNFLSKYFVCILDNRIIGYISIWYIINEAHITNIGVLKEYQNRGIGSKLMEKLISYSKDNEMIGLTLEVNTKNKVALNLYKKFNFEISGTRKEYYEHTKDDAYILWRNE